MSTHVPELPAAPTGSTAADLIAFWNWALAAGQVRADTGRGNRNACRRILSTQPAWPSLDVRDLEEEAVIADYTAAHRDQVSQNTLDNYSSTFRRALGLFRDYLADPAAWSPDLPRHHRRPPRAASLPPQAPGVLQIHLAGGRTAELRVPLDLTPADAEDAMKTLRRVLPALATGGPVPRKATP